MKEEGKEKERVVDKVREGRKGGREEGSESDRKEEFNIEEERGRRRIVNKRGRQRKGERN